MKKLFLSIMLMSLVLVFTNYAYADDNQTTNTCKKNNTKCANFVDANNDGICDKFVNAENEGKCDNFTQSTNCKKGKGKGNCGRGMMNGKKKNCENKNNCTNSDQTNIKSLDIYPNPSTNSTNVKFELIKQGNVEIQISDMAGAIVKNINIGSYNSGSNEVVVDLSGINSGNYYLSIISGKSRSTKQIIIQ